MTKVQPEKTIGLPFSESRRMGFPSCWCGSKKSQEYAQGEWADLGYVKFVKCSQCGTIRQVDIPPDEVVYRESYWNSYAGETVHKTNAGEIVNAELWEWRGEGLIDKALEQVGSQKVLDIGCGFGEMLQVFKARGWTVLGCDLGKRAVEAAREAGLVEPGEIRVGTELDIKPGEGPFDLVILWHALEHCRKPLETLARVKKLAPGGLVVVQAPDCSMTTPVVRGPEHSPLPDFTLRADHVWYWTQDQAFEMFEKAGFDVLRIQHAAERYGNQNAWIAWLDTK